MTRFLLKLDPSYAKFVEPQGTYVVQLDKAIYDTIEAARLWYETIYHWQAPGGRLCGEWV